MLNARLLAYRKEFPQKAWLPNQLWEQKTTEHSHLYYNAMKPIFFILTINGIFPAFRNRSGKIYILLFCFCRTECLLLWFMARLFSACNWFSTFHGSKTVHLNLRDMLNCYFLLNASNYGVL